MVGRPEGRLKRMGRRKRGREGTDEKERGQEVKEGNGKNREETERLKTNQDNMRREEGRVKPIRERQLHLGRCINVMAQLNVKAEVFF